MIKTHSEACLALGVNYTASMDDIKTQYKRLVKLYHPDEDGSLSSREKYTHVVEAYEFLRNEMNATAVSTKVYGQSKGYSSAKDHERFEKRYKKQQQEKKEQFERKLVALKEAEKEEEARRQKAEEDYKRAMEAIDAIRAARIIESWIRENDNTQ